MKINFFSKKFYLTIFVIWQLFSVLLISIGVWPGKAAYLNLILQGAAILFFDPEYALYSLILSIPFYVIIPNPAYDALAAWRFVFFFALVVYLVKIFRATGRIRGSVHFFDWDKYLRWLVIVILISIAVAPIKGTGIKKLLFCANIYVLYFLTINIIRDKAQIIRTLWVSFSSLAVIVLLGYIQFASTFQSTTYYFWQYWAMFISRAFYGNTLANTLAYSNSWFSFSAGQPPSLRMFSILPDSHAFALVAMFSIPFASALLFFAGRKWQRVLLWVFICLAALSLSLSGTRGLWASIVAPIAVLVFLFAQHYGRKITRPMYWPIILFFVFLVLSPLAQKLVSIIRSGQNYGNLVLRAESIYNLQESSNAGRLRIWKQTLIADLHNPILGVGFGNFVVTLAPDQSQVQNSEALSRLNSQNNKAFNLPNRYITAHDLYLDVLTETGIIGLFFFLLYFWKVILSFWKFFRAHYLYAEDGMVFFVVNAGLYLVWLLAYSFFDGTLLNDRVLMYFFLILGISAVIMRLYREGGQNG